jgi:hypothetical protein
VLVAKTEEKLQQNQEVYQKELGKMNIEVNIKKSETMIISTKKRKHRIAIGTRTSIRIGYKLQLLRHNHRIV